MTSGDQQLRAKAALETVRSVLVAIIFVALFGSIAAVVSYRADVSEAREQVRQRVAQQGRLYAESLALHFDLLRVELQRLADRGFSALAAHDPSVLQAIQEDAALFGEGMVLLDLRGRVVWSEPALDLGATVQLQPWFQHVLATEQPAVDELLDDESSRIAVALPVREGGALTGVLVGVVRGTDRLLYGVKAQDEQLLLISSRQRVLLPREEPAWSRTPGFDARVEALRARGNSATWTFESHEVMAEGFPVRSTALHVVAIESEALSIEPIRRRLNAQLVFLLVVQAAALGAFVLFLRRTWRAFLEAEKRVAEQEKMAALGSAASLIAHEVKNSLNGLKAASSLLEVGGDTSLATRTISGQVDRLGHLARSLLSFSRPTELRRVPVALDAVTRETVQALRSLPEFPDAKVELALGAVPSIESDPLLLTTAIDNLVRNAIEAAVAAKDVGKVSEPVVTVQVSHDEDFVRVRIEDNAGGPPEGFEARVGEPFFTTKPRGIGLGLAMARRAVEQLGGTLRFERLPAGSRFEIALPLPLPPAGGDPRRA